jgi:5'-methylthioinosine phosphorylase
MVADDRSFGIIVGSGMADFGQDAQSMPVDTPLGVPSALPRRVSMGGRPVFVLPRHGVRHSIAPHRINYRANALALQALGVTDVISLNTVGVIPDEPGPGELALPDQLIDYTWGREHTFRDGDFMPLDHIEFTEPFCSELRGGLLAAARSAGVACRDGGVYGATQGPRLESAAEVDRLERDGVAYIGMTAMPEVALVRELGLRVACLSLVVNPAAGRGQGSIHGDIEASMASARSAAIQLLESFFAN